MQHETSQRTTTDTSRVDLYWIPLGSGEPLPVVRISGWLFEAGCAVVQRRDRQPLFHSALLVVLGTDRYVIEMAPVWKDRETDHGAACQGPVGLRWLGRSSWFRYEVRCWRGGTIPDIGCAVDSPVRMSADTTHSQQLLSLVESFPPLTWGRDELGVGEMWNSNTLVSWLLERSGHDLSSVEPPAHGRAPGWHAGVAAARQAAVTPPFKEMMRDDIDAPRAQG